MAIHAQYTDEAHTQISVTLEAGDILGNFVGPIEFAVGMAVGNKEHDALEEMVAEGHLAVTDYVPPPAPFQEVISDRQFYQQLAVQGDIEKSDALAAVQTGVIPSKLMTVINGLPTDQQFSVQMLLAGATQFQFSNPLTMMLAQALTPPRTADQMKALWVAAAAL